MSVHFIRKDSIDVPTPHCCDEHGNHDYDGLDYRDKWMDAAFDFHGITCDESLGALWTLPFREPETF